MSYLFLLLLCILPADKAVVDARCDLTEINHLYDDEGKLVFDQYIYYEYYEGNYYAIGWKIIYNHVLVKDKDGDNVVINLNRFVDPVKKKAWDWNEGKKEADQQLPYVGPFRPGSDYPQLNRRTGLYEARYIKNVAGIDYLYELKTKQIKETWTQYDPELVAQRTLPKEFRPVHPLNSDKADEYFKLKRN